MQNWMLGLLMVMIDMTSETGIMKISEGRTGVSVEGRKICKFQVDLPLRRIC